MRNKVPQLIEGAIFRDDRGTISSCNGFNMSDVQRMYMIAPASAGLVRAWQGHKLEEKWFFCVDGSFEIKLVGIDDFENPADNLFVQNFSLEAGLPQVLFIPGGYANGFKASSENSRLIVFSNFNLTQSTADDFRYPADKWNVW
ncbi:WxcM-like domain-containing protein [Daejeonella oryzae]|uniref:WxcM-like domain-containing protein n=1 Tax=Daejeonella oryzae TaxID=1122943 RepID=UPI00047EC54C|nr:WxcM-like domain-containing protein [Daejeonella oryzae]